MINSVITISRQYGSGGRFVAKMLAERLGIPYYDNEIITLAAKDSGITEQMFENAENMSSHSLLYSLSMYGASSGIYGLTLADKVFFVQSNIIKECAEKGPCVIVGRCANHVLKDMPNVINVFLYSDIDSRIERVQKYYKNEAKNIKDDIYKRDKKRAAYYNYYASNRWGNLENYHISLHTDAIGIDCCVNVLEKYILEHNK